MFRILFLKLRRSTHRFPVKAGRIHPQARHAFREVLSLAWPVVTAMGGEVVMGLVDTKLVGGLGAAALGGVSIATALLWFFYTIVLGFMRGMKVRTAHALGAGALLDGVQCAKVGVIAGALAGVVLCVLAQDITWVLHVLRIDSALIPYAQEFFLARLWGVPATYMLVALIEHREGITDTRTPMYVTLGGNLLNAALAYGLVYGRWGLPALGVRGAGYGTTLAEVAECVFLLLLFVRYERQVQRSVSTPRSTLSPMAALRDIAQLGLPTAVQFGCEMFSFTVLTAILGNCGEAQIAAHQIVLSISRIAWLPGIAMGEVASVLVGRSLGAHQIKEADESVYAALCLSIAFQTSCGLFLVLWGEHIVRLFTSEPAILALTQRLFPVMALFQAFDAASFVFRGALRGAKDVRVVAALSITASWLCVPTAAFFLAKKAGFGVVGGWYGFVAETFLVSLFAAWRWHRGSWRRTLDA